MSAPPDRRFLVLHGWTNRRPPEHWQWQLVDELRRDGEQVLYPQLPNTDAPSLALWTELLRAELAQLGDGERVVIAHSLGATLWLHAAGLLESGERVNRVVLTCPPSPVVLARHPEVLEFSRVRPDAAAIDRAAGSTRVVHTDNDPFCPEGAAAMFGDAAPDRDLIPGGEHLNPDSGYGHWPAMTAWCRDPLTRLVAR